MIIRAVEDKDFESIFRLNNKTQKLPWSEEAMRSEMSVRNPFSSVLESEDGVLSGYVFIRNVGYDREITAMGVTEDHRRKGYGTRLLEHVVSLCKTNPSVEKLLLEVAVENVAAINLYKRIGFQNGRVRKGYYSDGSDGLEMTLLLT